MERAFQVAVPLCAALYFLVLLFRPESILNSLDFQALHRGSAPPAVP